MAAKTESHPPSAAKDAPAAAPAAPVVASTPKSRGLLAWLPVATAVLLAPAATWATVEFVLLPRLQRKVAATAIRAAAESTAPEAAEMARPAGDKSGRDGKGGAPGEPKTFEFQNVVVNLAGTMGTRYLKTTFLVTGASGVDIKAAFDAAKPRLTDVTLNVLSSLSLADLEEPGSKNVIREKLVGAYNQALGKRVADQVYFSDFVIQ
ncbi:MAG: flagellar basal body-associated FliL family protein [Verrucomicrobia bacterium]|nr:flagellar basal body-associated FliL family protein [Verrucomicrobiota bacterium]